MDDAGDEEEGGGLICCREETKCERLDMDCYNYAFFLFLNIELRVIKGDRLTSGSHTVSRYRRITKSCGFSSSSSGIWL